MVHTEWGEQLAQSYIYSLHCIATATASYSHREWNIRRGAANESPGEMILHSNWIAGDNKNSRVRPSCSQDEWTEWMERERERENNCENKIT